MMTYTCDPTDPNHKGSEGAGVNGSGGCPSAGDVSVEHLGHGPGQAVRERKTLVATTPDGIRVELLPKISGYPFSEMAKDAATFSVRGIPVRVGQLNKLLHSKWLAGRPKDARFLKRYEGLLEEEKQG